VISFLESVLVTLAGAAFAACWHIFARNGQPAVEDLAFGFDLIVAAMVTQLGFLPGSHGLEVNIRWIGWGVLLVILMGMTVFTRFCAYEDLRVYMLAGHPDLPVWPMKRNAVWVTSIIGCVVLCVFWWLNVNIELVVSAWTRVLH